MKKWLIIGSIGAVALVAVLTKTNVFSYANTLFAQVSKDAKDRVPTKFELERIRNEIAALDSDISAMIRPIAENKATITKMHKDIDRSQKNIDETKKVLLAVVEDLKGNPAELNYAGKPYKAEYVRQQLARDTDRLKQSEKQLKAQLQMLEAKEQALKATQEQLAKVISKKREYEVRLTQLEADEESLRLLAVGTDVKVDSTRAAQIEEALAAVEHRQSVAKQEIEMKTGELANIPLHDRRTAPATDLNTIRNYLEGNEPAEKAASNR
jgi:peptidoglycan hydrolase CwlO-like protein